MFKRPEVRHTCYRLKKGLPSKPGNEWLVEHINEAKLDSDSWEDFSINWDLHVSRDKIVRILPETNQVFVNNACVEFKTKISMGMSKDILAESLDIRKRNIFDFIELNFAGQEVPWEEYNDTWGIDIDYQTKRIEVYRHNTVRNEVEVKPAISTPMTKKPLDEAVHTELKITERGEITPSLLKKLEALLAKDKA
jgi:hypothetical protein